MGDKHLWLEKNLDSTDTRAKKLHGFYHKVLDGIKDQIKIANIYTLSLSGEKIVDISSLPLDLPLMSHVPRYADKEMSQEVLTELFREIPSYVTDPYPHPTLPKRMITGFAPIINHQDNTVVGVLVADLDLQIIDDKIQFNFITLTLTTLSTIIVIIAGAFFVANKISKPINKLKDSALTIAAGNYGEVISVEGSREITDLANTFNTMTECLKENVSRLNENALIREHMYGKRECAFLLQQHIINTALKKYEHPQLSFKHVNISSASPHAFYLRFHDDSKETKTGLTLIESNESGFEAIYNLLAVSSDICSSLPTTTPWDNDFTIHHTTLDPENGLLTYQGPDALFPMVWCSETRLLRDAENSTCPIAPGDFVIFYNNGFTLSLPEKEKRKEWISQVLQHFSGESLETIATMITKKIGFLIKTRPYPYDIHLICTSISKGEG